MASLINDTAVGYIMEKVDMVLVGAESVFENGGILNSPCYVTNVLICRCHQCIIFRDMQISAFTPSLIAIARFLVL